MLDFIEEPLDQIAFLVDVLVLRDGLRSGTRGWNHGLGTNLRDAAAKAIGVKAPVTQQLVERQTADQILGLHDVIHLACGQDEANGITERIHACIDLRAQAAARTPDRLIFAPFAPAACWCARTMVVSMIGYSKSGFSTNALKMRSHTPFLAHRRKRWNTLFQWPNSFGRSRHGAPREPTKARHRQNRRLSSPCRPSYPEQAVRCAATARP